MTCGRLLEHVAAYYPAWDHAYADHLMPRVRPAAAPQDRHAVEGREPAAATRAGAGPSPARPPAGRADRRPRPGGAQPHAVAAGRAPRRYADDDPDLDAPDSRAREPGGPRGRSPRTGGSSRRCRATSCSAPVGRYRVEVPAGWQAPRELQVAGARSSGGREAQWTLVGDRRELIDRLTIAGALRARSAAAGAGGRDARVARRGGDAMTQPPFTATPRAARRAGRAGPRRRTRAPQAGARRDRHWSP